MKYFKSALKYLVIIICGYLIVFGINKISENKKKSQSAKVVQSDIIPVKKITLLPERIENIIEINGKLIPEYEVTISSEVDGAIEQTFFEMGGKVNAGDVLCKIKDVEYSLKYNQALQEYNQTITKLNISNGALTNEVNINNINFVKKAAANYENIKANLWRVNELRKNDLTSKQIQDDLEMKLKSAEADFQSAKEDAKNLISMLSIKKSNVELNLKKLNDTKIIAPFSGYVKKRITTRGEYVKTGMPVYSIVQSDPIKFIGQIPEDRVNNVAAGTTVEVSVEFIKKIFIGKVSRINPVVSNENHSVEIEVEIANNENILKPGFFVSGKIITGVNNEAVAIPNEALMIYAGVTKVFIIRDGKAYAQKVKLGRAFLNKIEIIEGLKGNETLAVSNLTKLFNESKVKIME